MLIENRVFFSIKIAFSAFSAPLREKIFVIIGYQNFFSRRGAKDAEVFSVFDSHCKFFAEAKF